MKRLRSPIWWFGGKGNMVAKILPLFPQHRIYVEPFGGGASLLMAKPPSPVEVYNDLDSGLVNMFRVLRDEGQFERFHRLVSLTPYSREEYNDCRRTWQEAEDDVGRAYRFYVVARQSFGGRFASSWGFDVTASSRGMALTCSQWLAAIEGLPAIHERLMRVQIEHDDFRKVLATYDTPSTLFYCDPPYVPETRKNGGYHHEMTATDHEDLVQRLLGLQGMVVLSGYNHPIYTPLEQAGWRRMDFETICYAAARTRGTGIQGEGAALAKQSRTESVWLSPNCEQQLWLHK